MQKELRAKLKTFSLESLRLAIAGIVCIIVLIPRGEKIGLISYFHFTVL
jgi:hypothetical protein